MQFRSYQKPQIYFSVEESSELLTVSLHLGHTRALPIAYDGMTPEMAAREAACQAWLVECGAESTLSDWGYVSLAFHFRHFREGWGRAALMVSQDVDDFEQSWKMFQAVERRLRRKSSPSLATLYKDPAAMIAAYTAARIPRAYHMRWKDPANGLYYENLCVLRKGVAAPLATAA